MMTGARLAQPVSSRARRRVAYPFREFGCEGGAAKTVCVIRRGAPTHADDFPGGVLVAVVIGESLLYGSIIHMPHLGRNGGAVAYGGELCSGSGKALFAVGELCPRAAQPRGLQFEEAE